MSASCAAAQANPCPAGPGERDILRGASNKEIGTELGIAETTVKIHVQHVLRKLAVSTRVQAAVLATSAGVS